MNDRVPREAGVVDNNMYFSISKVYSVSDNILDLLRIQNVPWCRYRFPAGVVDLLSYVGGFLSIDVLNHNTCPLFGE